MTGLPALMVAPNGARLTKADHPALPMTLPEIIATTRDCHDAGADGLHLHLRDREGGHLLDAGAYREAVEELTTQLPAIAVQITTEAVGKYEPPHQRQVALNSGASMVSASVRELCRDPEDVTRAFYEDCAARGIAIQHILYDREDGELLARTLPDGLLTAPDLQLLFVLGRYAADQNSDPHDLDDFLDWMGAAGLSPDWAVCAFGQNETASLVYAASKGAKCRVGFENARVHADGRVAKDNAERVKAVRDAISAKMN
ncbi:3-keto-5-aminohexanoate cleavage protein [Aliiroseovarius sediminis]|uniref:3-keto-5-aminohexanoate cleavage protein n=1 Tax=Aliiroseovarius sediminis TaxID=2925839 RepID=UPI001F561136|nr:3-keto-5-aminohexanoate cleavage protein [uncultured Aliiroseovarius sp.]MCI2395151.1 3-keto-5-aminohexanoate cleavage protein [Aliiroseovarius sediminis]